MQTAAAVFVQLIGKTGEVIHQCGAMGGTLFGITQAVDFQR